MQIVILFLFALIALGLFYFLPRVTGGTRPTAFSAVSAAAAVVVGFFLASTAVIVPFGTNDLVTFNGGLTDRVLQPGLNFKLPLVNGVYPMNMQMRALEVTHSDVFTRDQQNADNDYVINFSLQDQKLKEIASQFKGDDGKDTSIAERLIRPRAEYWLKQIEPRYDAASLLIHRSDVANELQKQLERDISPYGVRLSYVSITNISFGPKYQATSEERAAAEQEYQKELTVLKTKKVLADQNVVTAEGQARANAAIRQSFGADPRIAEALVKMRLIELMNDKWKGDMPQSLGGGSLLSIGATETAPAAPK